MGNIYMNILGTMKNTLKAIMLFSGYALCTSCSYAPISHSWAIPDPSLPEIAMIRTQHHDSYAVIYNPDMCKQIGDACSFFLLHAYAHGWLKHTILAEPDDYPLSEENSADCFAAKYSKPGDVKAAIDFLLDEQKDPALKVHGDSIQRAAIIRECAKLAYN